MARLHQNNFATNLTSNQIAGVTTTPLNDIPSIAAPFYLAFDATNLNGNYEVVDVTSKTATNVLHAATTYAHTTAEEVRMVVPAVELDAYSAAIESPTGWNSISATLTFSSADAPTYVCTTSSDMTGSIGVGMRIKLTHSASTKYFIVTAIDASTITLYGGTDYTLAATAITAPYYSNVKAPLGFPLDPLKWSVVFTSTTIGTQSGPTINVWYNAGTTNHQISVPIGAWDLAYKAHFEAAANGVSQMVSGTLSTANNTESDSDFTVSFETSGAAFRPYAVGYVEKNVILASKTTYYLNVKTSISSTSDVWIRSDQAKTLLRAVCAYL